jgi:murein DD-endopeptidase MepM/ murein hydrolase activator NlpD
MRTWIHPVKDVHLGSRFGAIDAYHAAPGHRGDDYNGFKAGENLLAVSNGKIVLNKWSDVLGNVVVLRVGLLYFGYCHMEKPSTRKVGEVVAVGDVIGHAGNSGSASSGVHLHLTLGWTKLAVFAGKVSSAYNYIAKKIKAKA